MAKNKKKGKKISSQEERKSSKNGKNTASKNTVLDGNLFLISAILIAVLSFITFPYLLKNKSAEISKEVKSKSEESFEKFLTENSVTEDDLCGKEDLHCLLNKNNGGWYSDPKPSQIYSSQCNIEVIDLASHNLTIEEFESQYIGKEPVIVKGLINKWKAHSRWTRQSFKKLFGRFPTQVSPGSTIVFGGGGRSSSSDMLDFLDRMEDHMRSEHVITQPMLDFNFDSGFLEAMPGIYLDYRTPKYFESFNSFQSMQQKSSWHMLSLGATRGGLPSHVHGETWLGLVFGMKRWFIYPPGKGPKVQTVQNSGYHHLEGSWEWYQKVYPLVKDSEDEAETPMECVQMPGDVMYLPQNWKHITLNIGEAIGVGGQGGYPAVVRLEDNLFALQKNPEELEALLGLGLSHAHLWQSHQDVEHFNRAIEYLEKAIELVPTQPEAYLIKGEILLAKKELTLADEHINDAIEVFSRKNVPDSVPTEAVAGVQLKLAQLYLAFEDGAKAEPIIKQALEIYPEYAQGWHDFAYSLIYQDKLEEAEDAVGEALKRSPHDRNCKITLNHIDWRKKVRDMNRHEPDSKSE